MLTIKLSETHTQASQEIPGNLQEELDSLRREVEGLRKALKEGKAQGEAHQLEKPNLLISTRWIVKRFLLLCVKPWKIRRNHASVWMP